MRTKPSKIEGGFQDYHWSAGMTPIRLRKEHIEAIHAGDMDDDWYGEVADVCYAKARERIIKTLRTQLAAIAYQSPLREKVVDRRPSCLSLLRAEA